MNDDNSSSTGHTKFDKFQSYKTDEIFKKSAQYKKMLSSISEHNINQAQKYLDRKKQKLMKFFPILFISEPFLSTKNCFNMPAKVFVHFDLDCFFASVETLSNSHYKDIPIAVGSNMMISTANYKARRYGVRSAMPGYKAKAMCSDLVIIKPDIEKYKQYSNVIMRLLGKFDQNISIKSIDEAVLCFDEQKYRNALNVIKNEFRYKLEDILKSNTGVYCVQETPCEAVEENGGRWIYEANNTKNENSEISKNYPKNHDAVNQKKYTVSLIDTFCFANIEILVKIIREIILEKTGLTISAGISVTKLLSKLASSIKKPNEQTTIKINCQEFLNKKPIEKLNGIGKQTKLLLENVFNIKTVKDLKDNLKFMMFIFKKKTFENLFYLAFGVSKEEIAENESIFNKIKRCNQILNNQKFENKEIFDDGLIMNELITDGNHYYNKYAKILSDDENRYNVSNDGQKGISVEHTFHPSFDNKELINIIWFLSEKLSKRLFLCKKIGNVFVLKLKFEDFTIATKQRKFENIPRNQIEIFNNFTSIYKDIGLYTKVRLIGLRITNLIDCSNLDLLEIYMRKTVS